MKPEPRTTSPSLHRIRSGALRSVAFTALLVSCIAVFGASLRRAAEPVFSESHAFLEKPMSLEITCKTAGAKIFYTTDGSMPVPGKATLYSAPLTIAATTTLRASSFADDIAPSATVTETCLFLRDVVRQTGANFPANWGTNQGKPVPADYVMDPEITAHPDY